MAPPRTIPVIYRIWFTWVDPIVSLGTSILCLFNPKLLLDAIDPSIVSTSSTHTSAMLHQLSGLYFMNAINGGVLLRYTSDVGTWKILQGGVFVVDNVILASQRYTLEQQGRLELAALRAEDWAAAILTLFCAILRVLFILGVGFEADRGYKKRV